MNRIIKIRWYHWMIYKIFFKTWTPILEQNPQMVRAMSEWQKDWLDRQARPRPILQGREK